MLNMVPLISASNDRVIELVHRFSISGLTLPDCSGTDLIRLPSLQFLGLSDPLLLPPVLFRFSRLGWDRSLVGRCTGRRISVSKDEENRGDKNKIKLN